MLVTVGYRPRLILVFNTADHIKMDDSGKHRGIYYAKYYGCRGRGDDEKIENVDVGGKMRKDTGKGRNVHKRNASILKFANYSNKIFNFLLFLNIECHMQS